MASDPPAKDAGLFGTFFHESECFLHIIGVPWEPTASYGRGASQTPREMVKPSHQLDFFDLRTKRDLAALIGMLPEEPSWRVWNEEAMELADQMTSGQLREGQKRATLERVNALSMKLNDAVYQVAMEKLGQGRSIGVLGGDHSSPLGAMKAVFEKHPTAGTLHIDAHHDLRIAYEGFTYSHASIMHHLLTETPSLGNLVSVGIRDFCSEEFAYAKRHPRIHTFYGPDLDDHLFRGISWQTLCGRILEPLPSEVYISFDIDGLKPSLCPHTGTPVPGGLDYAQVCFLLNQLVESGRHIVGFDLCEIAPNRTNPNDEWDLNVGARILYKLCCLTLEDRLNGSIPESS